MLEVQDLTVAYGPVQAVRSFSFTCAPGQVLTIVGANGSGKSSTLLAVSGALRRGVTGSINLDGTSVDRLPAERRVAAGISLVPERRRILATLTVRDNLVVAASAQGKRRSVAQRVDEVMDRFPVLRDRAGRGAGLLSGGEQQMLAIGRALLCSPKILLLDEPSLGLAPQIVDEVFDLVQTLRIEGLGIVLVEQNAQRASAIADHTILLRQGSAQTITDDAELDTVDAYFGTVSEDKDAAS